MMTGLWLIFACGDSSTDAESVKQTTQQTVPTDTNLSANSKIALSRHL